MFKNIHLHNWFNQSVSVLSILAIFLAGCTPAPALTTEVSPLQAPASAIHQLATSTASPTSPAVEQTLATPTATILPAIVHLALPADPEGGWGSLTDTSSVAYASQGRVASGDYFQQNQFERPFTAQDMHYLPAVDILETQINRSATWFYVTLSFAGTVGADPAFPVVYGVEIDLNLDGRGEILIWAAEPKTTIWSTDGVQVWQDLDSDVGGNAPIQPETVANPTGYETLIFDGGIGTDPDSAWVRLSSPDATSVQIAFKRSLINDDPAFAWGVWADAGVRQPGWFDYNDHFTLEEAGSPIAEQKNYPLKALFALDNTCRIAFGFTPVSVVPGMCPFSSPTNTPPPVSIAPAGPVYLHCNEYKDKATCDADPGKIGGCIWIPAGGASGYCNP